MAATNVTDLAAKRAQQRTRVVPGSSSRSSSRQATIPGSNVKLPLPTEAEVRRAVRDYLKLRGWFTFHLLQALGCYAGLSDLVAVKSGRVVFVELKRPGGRQRPDQVTFQDDLERAGGEYLLVTSVDDVMQWERGGRP